VHWKLAVPDPAVRSRLLTTASTIVRDNALSESSPGTADPPTVTLPGCTENSSVIVPSGPAEISAQHSLTAILRSSTSS